MINIKDIKPNIAKGGHLYVMISPKTCNTTTMIMGKAILAPGENIISHFHEYGEESFIVTKGKGILNIDNVKYEMNDGEAFFIPKNVIHSIINTEDEILELIFATAPLAPPLKSGDTIENESN
jgi:putative monooxygenase